MYGQGVAGSLRDEVLQKTVEDSLNQKITNIEVKRRLGITVDIFQRAE